MIELPAVEARNLYLSEGVSQGSLGKLTEAIVNINAQDDRIAKISAVDGFIYQPKPINLYIDSYGGDVYAVMGLVAVIEESKTPIYTIATGAQMSCGLILLLSGHKRFSYKYATLMYHQISNGFWGDLKGLQECEKETKRLQDWWEAYVLAKTKMTKKKIKAIFNKKQDYYMDAKKALKLGVIDEIIGSV